ncbi:MAG: winged helix-turn-helix transcriptional regulator [Thermoplasmata archaeon]|nr:winged helix-turn-helix transcriptional regulator [Thermoplasmata archaeon]
MLPRSEVTLPVGVQLPDDPYASPSGGHVVPVRLLTDQGTMDVSTALEVFVPEVRGVSVTPVGSWRAYQGTPNEMHLQVLVRDRSNIVQERAVWLTHDAGPAITYVNVGQPALMMSSGSAVPVSLTVRFDPGATPEEHLVRLRVHDGTGLLKEVELPVQVSLPELKLVGDLEVRATQDEGHYAGGEASIYVVTGSVENTGDRYLDFAKVEVYDVSGGTPVSLGYVPIYDLPAGSSRNFRFTIDRAQPGDNTVMAHPSAPGTNGDPYKDSLQSRFEAEAVTPAPEGPLVFFVFAVALGSMAGLVAILATEAGRFALLALVVIPLYTRLKPEQVTDHFIRGQILGYVKANPGETYTHIRKALKLSNGTFVYHARILETQGHIRSVKDGANRRFYPADMRIPSEVKDVELNQVQRLIYTIVMEYPGISQTKIAKMVKLAPSTVNYHVNIMTKVGVIERKRSGRLSLCFATEDAD